MWVRTASKRDIPTISQLLGQVWHDTYDNIYGVEKVNEVTAQWHSKSALERNLKLPASEFLVADDGKTIAGTAFASQIEPKTAKLHQLYILPEFQGKGVGKLLLEEIEDSFFEVQNLVLEVEELNEPAIRFYKKYGYRQTGKTANCGADDSGIAALVFTKKR
jgi:ribosomal protein S18 acetylase RimI-like enzyme